MLEAPQEAGRVQAKNVFQSNADNKAARKEAPASADEPPDPNATVPRGETSTSAERVQPAEPANQFGVFLDEVASKVLGDQTRLKIERHEDTGRYIYQSIDKDSGEVLREFPPEQFLSILARFMEAEPGADKPSGAYVDQRA